jgi:hypothetical protein
MAKCPLCNSRKGKRQCLIAEAPICSLCCGTQRSAEPCAGCGFYQAPKRDYNAVPAYSVSEMDGNMELQRCGNAIEGALGAYDAQHESALTDKDAIRIIELLIDRYHFGDQGATDQSGLIRGGVEQVDKAIKEDLADVSRERLVKVLGVIRFVARRRTKLGREYMQVVHQYVGLRLGPGIRGLTTL